MTTNTPNNSTNNQDPLNTGLPDLTATPTPIAPEMVIPISNIPMTVEPEMISSAAISPPIAIQPEVDKTATNVELKEDKLTPEMLQTIRPIENVQPIKENKPVIPIITTGPSLETKSELPGQSLNLSPDLTQKILPVNNIQPEVKTLEQLKITSPVEPVIENKRKAKDILLIVVIFVVGVAALIFGLYIALNAA